MRGSLSPGPLFPFTFPEALVTTGWPILTHSAEGKSTKCKYNPMCSCLDGEQDITTWCDKDYDEGRARSDGSAGRGT